MPLLYYQILNFSDTRDVSGTNNRFYVHINTYSVNRVVFASTSVQAIFHPIVHSSGGPVYHETNQKLLLLVPFPDQNIDGFGSVSLCLPSNYSRA